jgi:hypothetical protein
MKVRRPFLGALLNGVPDVENLYPVLAGLRDGGRVELDLFVTSGLWRREARVRKLLRGSGMAYRVRPNKLMKAGVYYRRLLRGVDRLLVIGDPCNDESVFGARGRYIREAGIPTIHMQHGVIQFNRKTLKFGQLRDPKPRAGASPSAVWNGNPLTSRPSQMVLASNRRHLGECRMQSADVRQKHTC